MTKELTTNMKIIKEFQIVSTTPVDLKKQNAFHEGWELMKDLLKKEMMQTIEKLASQIYSLLEEGVAIRELKFQIMSLLKKLDGYLPTMNCLEQTFVDKPKKLVYCHEFMYEHDRLKHALDK